MHARRGLGIKDVFKPYDWTLHTEYSGSAGPGFEVKHQPASSSSLSSIDSAHHHVILYQVSHTDERINMELLKVHEPILFHDYVNLYAVGMSGGGSHRLFLHPSYVPNTHHTQDDYSDNGSMNFYARVVRLDEV